MPHITDERIGTRIASYRKLCGYTQREFAEVTHLSLGSIRKIEQGERQATQGFLIAAARALQVSIEDLTGQPYRDSRADERVHAPIPGIRAAVRHYDLPRDWYHTPRPVRELAADVQLASRYRAAAQYRRLGLLLPGLLEELTAAVHLSAGRDRQHAAGLLASSYYMAHSLAHRLGYRDLIGQLEDRMRWAADLSGDPLMRALSGWLLSYSFDMFGDYQGALRVLSVTREELESALPEPSFKRTTMLGSLHLRESTIASFARDDEATRHHIAEAARLARDLPGEQLWYHMTFGPANVGVHDVAAAVELKQPEQAVERARKLVFPARMAKTRQGHHHVAVARAYLGMERKDEALRELQKARKVAPEQTKYHPEARETARLLGTKFRRTTEELRSLTSWLGVKS